MRGRETPRRRKRRAGKVVAHLFRLRLLSSRSDATAIMFRLMASQAKKHPSLIPLFIFIGAGGTGAALYIMRLALRNPDVCWDKKNNPEPWNKLGPNDQYKFFAVSTDYKKLKKEGPDY